MASEPILVVLDLAAVRRCQSQRSSFLFDYWALTKPEVNFLIALATLAAFWMGCPKTTRAFPVVAASAHAARHGFRCERRRDSESGDRTSLRRANAAHRSAANRCWPNPTFRSPGFRSPVVVGRCALSRSRSESRRERACPAHAGRLFVPLYSAQTANAHVYAGRRISRCHARVDWIRRRSREARLSSVATLRGSLPLAIPAFHGNCVDVSRRLCASRVSGSSVGKRERPIHGMAVYALFARLSVSNCSADGLAPCQSGVRSGYVAAQFGFPLFCRETHPQPFEHCCSPAASGLGRVPSLGIRTSSACKDVSRVCNWG